MEGLNKILDKIAADPTNDVLVDRYLALVREVATEPEKADLVVDLARVLADANPREALQLLKMVVEQDPAHIPALEVTARCLETLGRPGKVEVINREIERIRNPGSQILGGDASAEPGLGSIDLTAPPDVDAMLAPPDASAGVPPDLATPEPPASAHASDGVSWSQVDLMQPPEEAVSKAVSVEDPDQVSEPPAEQAEVVIPAPEGELPLHDDPLDLASAVRPVVTEDRDDNPIAIQVELTEAPRDNPPPAEDVPLPSPEPESEAVFRHVSTSPSLNVRPPPEAAPSAPENSSGVTAAERLAMEMFAFHWQQGAWDDAKAVLEEHDRFQHKTWWLARSSIVKNREPDEPEEKEEKEETVPIESRVESPEPGDDGETDDELLAWIDSQSKLLAEERYRLALWRCREKARWLRDPDRAAALSEIIKELAGILGYDKIEAGASIEAIEQALESPWLHIVEAS